MRTPSLDLGKLRDWIGNRESVSDVITSRLESSLRAILDRAPFGIALGDHATSTIHWCLSPLIVPMAGLGSDGHPARGGFMPPVPLPRRMWAGGELSLLEPLRVGDIVTRDSIIEDVVVKAGQSGTLCFVTVKHRLSTIRGPALEERQDVVYRDNPGGPAAVKAQVRQPDAKWTRTVACDPVMLFRYSALTFNGHRIHYDRPYVTSVEGYDDLVVHGPLQATLLIEMATELRQSVPSTFSFRGVSPLLCGAFTLNAAEDNGGLRLWVSSSQGLTTMQANAGWR